MKQTQYKAIVIKGEGRGKELGFPTANLQPPPNFSLSHGIYTTEAKVANDLYQGILYWGTKGGRGESLEIHIFDFEKDIYGQMIEFCVGQFIREDRNFNSTKELTVQIRKDVTKAKELL